MTNMKILTVLLPPSIYHSCSTRKTLWEKSFTVREFSAVNMKKCGRQNVRKHRYIKGSEKYATLDILLIFGSLDKMRIINLDPKDDLGRSGKGLITSLGVRSTEKKDMPLKMLLRRTSKRLSTSLKSYLIRVMVGGGPT